MGRAVLIIVAIGSSFFAAPLCYASERNGETRTAIPKPGSTFRAGDYPHAAIAKRMKGGVSIRYEINESGLVTPGSCVVTATSKSELLDRTTCRVVQQRFRFEPALENGKPVKEVREEFVHWRLPISNLQYDSSDAVRIVRSRGRCIVDSQPEFARQAVTLPMGSDEQTIAINAAYHEKSACWDTNTKLQAPPLLLAGGIAEQFVRNDFADVDAAAVVSASKALVPRNEVEAIAHCVLQRNPNAAREIIETIPTGPEEASIIAKLVPDLGPCVSQGTSLTFNKPSVRSLVTLALYQSLAAAASTVAATSR